jgi:5'-deoxynucleotidase YfbR-like HD superfamily hydrolase
VPSSQTKSGLTAEHRRHISEGQKRRWERVRLVRCAHLASGALLDLRDPDPDVITLKDVAVSLARTCRFPGQAPRWHSVAEHSVIVAQLLREQGASQEVQLAGLMHDCAELGLSDIPTPVKALIRGHRRIERDLDLAILKALGLPHDLRAVMHGPVVKAADRLCLAMEVRDLLGTSWEGVPEYEGPKLRLGLTAKAAERAFLKEYRRLTNA